MSKSWLYRWTTSLSLLLVTAGGAAAQGGSITGQVVDRSTRQPLVGVQVYLVGTDMGAVTQDNGRYLILNVPTGTYTVETQFIGYGTGHVENVRVRSDEATTVDFELTTQVLKLTEVVATGTIDPTSGVKVPFTVGRVSKEDMPVPAVNAEASIRGKIAGVKIVKNTGQPGSGTSIVLRGYTSLNRSNEPLFVVDGVLLGESMVDVEALDIESIEVVKGAAASSLYGARAANGVISITTSRGRDVAEGDTRINFRSEIGMNALPSDFALSQYHSYKTNSSGQFIDNNGNVVDKSGRVLDDDHFQDNAYTGTLYDHIDRFFDPQPYMTNSLSIAQNTRSTNFAASFTDRRDGGVIAVGDDGFEQRSLRVNLDHRLRDDLNFSVSSYYSRSEQDDVGAGGVLYDIMFFPPDVDLFADNEDGTAYNVQPDPFLLQENPFYALANQTNEDRRSRIMGSAQVRYSPANFFSLEGNFSFDRSDRNGYNYTPKGFKNIGAESTGSISRSHGLTQAINAGLTGSLLQSFGDLTVRTKVSGSIENQTDNNFSGSGNEFIVGDVEDIDVSINRSAGSSFTEVKSLGYYVITGLDYQGKYIAEGLVRRDGSSLFGPENRWNTYYRGSAAWRMSDEAWWPIEALNEFKLRASIGTAGNRPGFSYQYETWSVGGGNVSKGTLGNKALKPELQTEFETGVDMIFKDRVSLILTYAKSTVEDQLLQIPLPAVFGYSTQWQNAGTVESSTWEAEIQANMLQKDDLSWQLSVVADRSRSEITEFDRGCYIAESGGVFYCEGESLGTMRGKHYLRSLSELPDELQQHSDHFAVNDDGLLVWVGEGNSHTDNLWFTAPNTQRSSSDTGVLNTNGAAFLWGMPIEVLDPVTGAVSSQEIMGNSLPDFNFGVGNTIRWKGFSFYGLVDSQIGGDIYNNTRQWTYRDYTHPDYDQANKDDGLKKPIDYYQKLYNVNSLNDWFVEDGTYLKLRELSVKYTFERQTIERLFGGLGVERLALGLVGRNLLTFTDYSGFDPEVGSGGNGTLVRYDGFGYPNFRTITATVEIEF